MTAAAAAASTCICNLMQASHTSAAFARALQWLHDISMFTLACLRGLVMQEQWTACKAQPTTSVAPLLRVVAHTAAMFPAGRAAQLAEDLVLVRSAHVPLDSRMR